MPQSQVKPIPNAKYELMRELSGLKGRKVSNLNSSDKIFLSGVTIIDLVRTLNAVPTGANEESVRAREAGFLFGTLLSVLPFFYIKIVCYLDAFIAKLRSNIAIKTKCFFCLIFTKQIETR